MLMVLQQEATAPFYATVLLLGINQFSGKHRMDWAKFKTFFFGVGILFAELIGILAAIGLIVGALSLTGMAGTLTNDLVFIAGGNRSEEHTSELQSLMRTSYAVFCLNKKTHNT